EAFAPDGWYRTGDLGYVDRGGFLFVTGRVKEVLVLGGGKKASPEDLKRSYGGAPEIAEVAVLEDKGALVALVRPEPAKLHERGVTNLRDGIRIILAERARELPSWQRLSGFALTDQPLPRTRLGKYRRFLLPALYTEAIAGGARRADHALKPEDAGLLRATMATDFAHWLAPTGMCATAFGMALYALNRLVMRGLFRLRVTGAETLPPAGAFVITANHVSDLDAMAVAAALPWSRFRRLYWAG